MAEALWFETLESSLTSSGLLKYHPPMAFSNDVQVLPFGPYDEGSGSWKFRTGLRFQTLSTDTAVRGINALTRGTITFKPGLSNGPGRIILNPADVLGQALGGAVGALPAWYPKKLLIVYDHIEPEEAKIAAAKLFVKSDGSVDHSKVQQLIKCEKKADPNFNATQVDQLVNLWMEDKIVCGLPITAGQSVGACAKDNNANPPYFAEVRMVESIDPPAKLFYNPSYLIALWDEKGWIDAKLHPEVKDISGPPSGTGQLTVVQGGGNGRITAAISSAIAGDTILILDKLTYEDEVIIDQKPISLTSTATKDDYSTYPTLDGKNDHRPITIRSINSGIAHIGKLIIENGLGTGTRKDGGGILVERANNTIISSCAIRNCKAPGLGSVVEILHPALFGEGFGGGIAVYHSSPGVFGCLIEMNNARGRGKGIGVFGYGWPTIVDCTVQSNGLDSGGGRADGGGLGIEIATTNIEDPFALQNTTKATLATRWDAPMLRRAKQNYVRIIDSRIKSNNAEDDGGGVYISVMSGVIMRSTTVSNNKAKNNGGGIRVTMGSRLLLRSGRTACIIQANVSNKDSEAVDDKGSGGGGLSVRNADLIDVKASLIWDNTALGWAGGGIYFLSSDEGTDKEATLLGLTFDWNDILWDIFGHQEAVVSINEHCSFKGNKATHLSGQQNHGKGGAIYVLRYLGNRESGFPLPPDKNSNGKLKAPPARVTIANTSVLVGSNTAVPNADFAQSDRIYLDDQTVPRVINDVDLGKAETSGKILFSYPEA
jgi:predicted outer membrane repeat protein